MKRNCGLYNYLAERDLFSKGEDAIAQGKKEYRKIYLREHKRSYRKKKTQHTITLAANEERQIAVAAKKHGMAVSQFIRLAALSYLSKIYLTPRLEAVHRVQQEIIITRSQIERIRQEKKSFWSVSKDEKIEALLKSFEQMVHASFNEPQDLEVLVYEAAKHNPLLTARLLKILTEP